MKRKNMSANERQARSGLTFLCCLLAAVFAGHVFLISGGYFPDINSIFSSGFLCLFFLGMASIARPR